MNEHGLKVVKARMMRQALQVRATQAQRSAAFYHLRSHDMELASSDRVAAQQRGAEASRLARYCMGMEA